MNGWESWIGLRVMSDHETAAGSSTSQNSSPFVNLFHMNPPSQTHTPNTSTTTDKLSSLVHSVVGLCGWAVSVGDGRGCVSV